MVKFSVFIWILIKLLFLLDGYFFLILICKIFLFVWIFFDRFGEFFYFKKIGFWCWWIIFKLSYVFLFIFFKNWYCYRFMAIVRMFMG